MPQTLCNELPNEPIRELLLETNWCLHFFDAEACQLRSKVFSDRELMNKNREKTSATFHIRLLKFDKTTHVIKIATHAQVIAHVSKHTQTSVYDSA